MVLGTVQQHFATLHVRIGVIEIATGQRALGQHGDALQLLLGLVVGQDFQTFARRVFRFVQPRP
ncbi:hypothetical protein D3C80_1858980 [compost metagenome]